MFCEDERWKEKRERKKTKKRGPHEDELKIWEEEKIKKALKYDDDDDFEKSGKDSELEEEEEEEEEEARF